MSKFKSDRLKLTGLGSSSFCDIKCVSKNENSWHHKQKTQIQGFHGWHDHPEPIGHWMMLVDPGIDSKCSTKVQSKCMLLALERLCSHNCLCHLFFLFLFNDNFNCNPETNGHLSQDDMSMQTEHLQQIFS